MIDGSPLHQQVTHGDITKRYVDGERLATSVPNGQDGIDFYDGSQLEMSMMPMGHGFTTVMHYADPLANAQDYCIEPLIL